MQNHLIGLYCFTCAEILENLAGLGAALFGIDLPADDHAAEHVHEQIQIEVLPTNRCGQIRDVPAVQLVWGIGTDRTRLAARTGRLFATSVGELLLLPQYPVESGLRGDIALLVSQTRNDLAWRQVPEFGRVRDRQQFSAFPDRKLVARLILP